MVAPLLAVLGGLELLSRGAGLVWAGKQAYISAPRLADLVGAKNAGLTSLAIGIAGVMLLGVRQHYASRLTNAIGAGGSRTVLGVGSLALILAALMAYDLGHRTPAPSPLRIASVQTRKYHSNRRSPTREHRKRAGGSTSHRDTGAPAESAPNSPAGSAGQEQKSPAATTAGCGCTHYSHTVHSSPPPYEAPEPTVIYHPGTATPVPATAANTSPPPASGSSGEAGGSATGSSGSTGTTTTTSPSGTGTVTNPGSAEGK